jgi:hypothetical protein
VIILPCAMPMLRTSVYFALHPHYVGAFQPASLPDLMSMLRSSSARQPRRRFHVVRETNSYSSMVSSGRFCAFTQASLLVIMPNGPR